LEDAGCQTLSQGIAKSRNDFDLKFKLKSYKVLN
jgi:hypothetical protein